MDTVNFLESVTSMWKQGNPQFWNNLEAKYGVSDLVEVMRNEWWGEKYLKHQMAVRETFSKIPSNIFTTQYIAEKTDWDEWDGFPKSLLGNYVSLHFKSNFKRGIKEYFLNHFNPNNIIGLYSQNKEGEKVAIERIKDSGNQGAWFLSFPNGLRGVDKDSFTWDTIKTLLELDEPFVLGYSELSDSKKVISAKIGVDEDTLEEFYETNSRVISWDFNAGARLYWNLNQRVHLITRMGMTFYHDDFITSFMNWRRSPF
jgi:hypothetical protein